MFNGPTPNTPIYRSTLFLQCSVYSYAWGPSGTSEKWIGLPWTHIRLWGTEGPIINAKVHRDHKGVNPNINQSIIYTVQEYTKEGTWNKKHETFWGGFIFLVFVSLRVIKVFLFYEQNQLYAYAIHIFKFYSKKPELNLNKIRVSKGWGSVLEKSKILLLYLIQMK
jgi:hypothetical protein